MRKTLKYFLLSIPFFLLISCNKNIKTGNPFIGKWKIEKEAKDTIIFNNESTFIKTQNGGLNNSFQYSYSKDSIKVQYRGPNKILVPASSHFYHFNKNELEINFSNSCYGFEKEIYKFIKIEEKDK